MITRRGLLRSGLELTLAGTMVTAAAVATAADAVTCRGAGMDPGLAGSLNYAESSPDPKKTCSGCGFFTAGSNGCGSCSIFNSTVNSRGHCDSWAARG
jgi:hypothetical protein